MIAMELARGVMILSPILALFAMGLAITLRSGEVNLNSGDGLRQLAGNLSQMLITLVTCLLVLALVQQLVGFRLGLFGLH